MYFQIPPAIVEFYQHPVDLLPPPSLEPGGPVSEEQTTEQFTTDTSLEEQEIWLKSVVSLQTGIAQYLAKKQIEKNTLSENGKLNDSAKEKPTASVQPVQNRELADKAACTTDISQASSSDSRLKNNGEQSLPNGPLVSTNDVSNTVNNGPLDVGKGAVSLLNPSNSSLNGELFEMAEPARSKSDSSSNGSFGEFSANGVSQESPQSSVMKVTWPNGDKVTSVSNSSQSSGNKNIVISAINRTNNVYTRVVPGVSGKSSGPTSILSPRAGSQSGKIGSNVLKSNSSSAGSSTKVITVNPSQTGM